MEKLYADREKIIKLLNDAIILGKSRGLKLAECEMYYWVEVAKLVRIELDRGVKVTVIDDLCRGDENVAILKFERDSAKVLYDSVVEAINIYKVQIRVIENDLSNIRKGV